MDESPSNPETEPQAESEGPGEEERIASIDDKISSAVEGLKSWISETFGSRAEPEAPAKDGDGESDIASQMKEALGILRRREKARGEDKPEAKPEPVAEKPPKEYRKITTLLWGGDD